MQLTPTILHNTDTNEPIAPMTLASQVFREDGTTMLDAMWFDAEDEEVVEDIDIATKDEVNNIDTMAYKYYEGDVNNIPTKRFGVYTCFNQPNLPVSTMWFSVINIPIAGASDVNYSIQIAFSFSGNNMYIRSCTGGSWSAWRTI